MTPTQARAFLAVAIEGSFTGAAKRLDSTSQASQLRSDCSNGSIRWNSSTASGEACG
jgi:hypothetical protein